MSIKSQITLLENTKDELRTAIMEKGVVVGANELFSNYPTRISQISTQSGTFDDSLKKLLDGSYTSYSIPEGTSMLRISAFNSYTSLASITIPTTLTYIGNHAFYNCTSLNRVNISDLSAWCKITFDYDYEYSSNPLSKAHKLYLNGSLITKLEIPSGIRTINDCAFYSNTSLTSVFIPDNVTTIGKLAFSNCNHIVTVEIGTGIQSIGANAFEWCSALESIVINAETPPSISTNSFSQTNNCPIYVPAERVESYKFSWPTYASRIQANTFAMKFTPTGGGTPIEVELNNLATAGTIESTDVPTEIKNGAGTLEIGEGVTSIGNNAFYGCTSLTSVTIPSGVTSIGNGAFYGMTSLTSVTVNATTPPTLGSSNVFYGANDFPIYVPAESLDAYKAATNWNYDADRIHIYGVADYIEVSYVCEVDENGKNTGMKTKTYQDLNPSSPTYGQSYTVTEEAALNQCLPISISKITDISQITDGKYLIVRESGYNDDLGGLLGRALYASKIKNTARGGGLNSGSENNWFYVLIDNNNINETWYVDDAINDGFVEYNSTDGTLEWTDETTGTTYYLSNQSNSSDKFTWSNLTTKPANRISPQQTSGGAFVFAQTKALGYYDGGSTGYFRWYDVSSSYMDGMALYKLDE